MMGHNIIGCGMLWDAICREVRTIISQLRVPLVQHVSHDYLSPPGKAAYKVTVKTIKTRYYQYILTIVKPNKPNCIQYIAYSIYQSKLILTNE